MTSGIYSITSPSGGTYIGSAKNFCQRWAQHRRALASGTHPNAPLQSAARKYGMDNLIFAEVLLCDADHRLLMYEQLAIDALHPRYNMCRVAGSRLGVEHSPATRAQMSAAAHLRKASPETREKLRAAWQRRQARARAAKQGSR